MKEILKKTPDLHSLGEFWRNFIKLDIVVIVIYFENVTFFQAELELDDALDNSCSMPIPSSN